MLSHNLIGVENSFRCNLALRYTAASFFEKVGQNAFVNNRNCIRGVGDGEANRQAIVVTFEAAVLDQSTDAKRLAHWRFFGRNLRRTKKENQIVLERSQHQPRCQAQCRETTTDKDDSLVTTFH